jgi:hypothetical protein
MRRSRYQKTDQLPSGSHGDDGLEPVDLTGRWVGFYRYRWEQLGTYPIVAEIQQIGNKIAGEMYDQITERSDDFVAVIGKDIAYESRRNMQQIISRFGTETVRNARLPDTSDIQGKVTDSHVQFMKSYRVQWSSPGLWTRIP